MSERKTTYQWLFGGLGTALVASLLGWALNRSPKPAITNTSSGNTQIADRSSGTQITNASGTVNVYQGIQPRQSPSPAENKKPEPVKTKPKVRHAVHQPAQGGNVVSPNGSINQSSTGPYSPNIVAGGSVTIANIPPPDRNITVKRAAQAVPILKESVGKVRVDTLGATHETDEINRFSGQLETLFTMGNWQVLEGFAHGEQVLATSTGVPHGEGVRCYAKHADSTAAKAAIKALEIVGFPCQEGAAPFSLPGQEAPDFYISVGTRISPE